MLKIYNMTLAKEVDYTDWVFPGGEIGVKINTDQLINGCEYQVSLESQITNAVSIEKMFALIEALRWEGIVVNLYLPYLPYARQDRICHEGEHFGLHSFLQRVCNSGVKSLTTVAVHNLEAVEKFKFAFANANVKYTNIPQAFVFRNMLKFIEKVDAAILLPDDGARKHIDEYTKYVSNSKIYSANKVRKDGKVTISVSDNVREALAKQKAVYVLDDICDGGATFIELAKAVKVDVSLVLCVVHGIFSKGTKELEMYYKQIWSLNQMTDAALDTNKLNPFN